MAEISFNFNKTTKLDQGGKGGKVSNASKTIAVKSAGKGFV
jgi:hypothetical protein